MTDLYLSVPNPQGILEINRKVWENKMKNNKKFQSSNCVLKLRHSTINTAFFYFFFVFTFVLNYYFLTLVPIAIIRCLESSLLSKQYGHFSMRAASSWCSRIAFLLCISSSSPLRALFAALETNMSSRVWYSLSVFSIS